MRNTNSLCRRHGGNVGGVVAFDPSIYSIGYIAIGREAIKDLVRNRYLRCL